MQFAKILSITSVVLAALWLIAPKGKTAQSFKYAMGIFVISVILATFNVSFLSLPENPTSDNTSAVTETAEKLTNGAAAYIIEELLKKCNIKFGEIQIITDNSDSSDINITKAYVELTPDDFNTAAEIIKKKTGIILVDGV